VFLAAALFVLAFGGKDAFGAPGGRKENWVGLAVKGQNVNLRDAPGTASRVLLKVSDGYFLFGLAEPVTVNGVKWFRCASVGRLDPSGRSTVELPENYGAKDFYISSDYVQAHPVDDKDWAILRQQDFFLATIERYAKEQGREEPKAASGGDREATKELLARVNEAGPEEITRLIQQGADVNAVDKEGGTVLMRAVPFNRNPEAIAALLKAGANVNAVGPGGVTALMTAVGRPNTEVLAILLKAGANVHAVGPKGLTTLMIASGFALNSEEITLLVKAGADVNATNKDGVTALIMAATFTRNPEVIAALLKAGADVTPQDPKGKTALDHAKKNDALKGNVGVLRLLGQ
jgi:hypothetical protein